jgi:hypothetical protein
MHAWRRSFHWPRGMDAHSESLGCLYRGLGLLLGLALAPADLTDQLDLRRHSGYPCPASRS